MRIFGANLWIKKYREISFNKNKFFKSLKETNELLEKFKDVKVLVIGDIMLDRYLWGSVSRISPEAPVPVVALEKSSIVAGGAANVAANVAGLGATPTLFGITGVDEDAKLFPSILKNSKISQFKLVEVSGRPTTVKTRVIAHHQQIVRVDQESTAPISIEDVRAVLNQIEIYIETNDIIVISDYGKGFLTQELLAGLITFARRYGKIVAVDPKGRDYSKYRGATILTPNQKETAEACNLENNSEQLIESSGRHLLDELSLEAILITQGENGIKLLEKNKETIQLRSTARKVFDVTGAGDTVIAALAVCLASNMGFREATEFANLAAGIVVEQIGTTAINEELLLSSAK